MGWFRNGDEHGYEVSDRLCAGVGIVVADREPLKGSGLQAFVGGSIVRKGKTWLARRSYIK
jgi:hypothetical protein